VSGSKCLRDRKENEERVEPKELPQHCSCKQSDQP
jgi:hypothetical protein